MGLPRRCSHKKIRVPMQENQETASIPGSRRIPEVGNGNPLQYSCLEKSVDRGGWWAAVYQVAKSWAGLSTQA